MRTRFLFPYWSRFLGYALILVHIPVVLYSDKLGFSGSSPDMDNNLLNSHHLFFMLTTLLVAIGLFLIAFSKEKIEDEMVSQLRLDSLQWAVYLNYFLLVISLILTNDTGHILVLNLMVPLVFFIARFRWKIYLNHRLLKNSDSL